MAISLLSIATDLCDAHHKVHYSPVTPTPSGVSAAYIDPDPSSVSEKERQHLTDLACSLLLACTFTIQPKAYGILTLPAFTEQTLMATALDRALSVIVNSQGQANPARLIHTDPAQQSLNIQSERWANDLSVVFSGIKGKDPVYDAVEIVVSRENALSTLAFITSRSLPPELQLGSGANPARVAADKNTLD